MPMELRKRKAPPAPAPATSKKPAKVAKTVSKAAEKVKEKVAEVAANVNGDATPKPAVGDTIALDSFGGEIETNDGTKTTLKALVDASKAGVVLFTYPKASTPGCTRQACHFRDAYEPLTSTGLAIYGLSTDSPKANTTFKEKQRLPYPLLCDPQATLIGAIGLKKTPKGTVRGVFVVDKQGKVLAAQAGSPEGTVEVVKGLVEGANGSAGGEKKDGDGEGEKAEGKGEEVVEKKEPEEEKDGGENEEKEDGPAPAGGADGANGEEKKE